VNTQPFTIPLSHVTYFAIGGVLILGARAIHYAFVTRYLNDLGISSAGEGSSVRDWRDLSAYRKARLAKHVSLTWWYSLWALQIVAFLWMVGWFLNGFGFIKISAPSAFYTTEPAADGYMTVFDVTAAGFRQWWFSASGLLFIAVGIAMPWLGRAGLFGPRTALAPTRIKWFRRFFLGFAILWTAVTFAGTCANYRGAVAAMQNGSALVIEGKVENFVPMPYTGHARESFTVGGVRFAYSDYEITAGFNNTMSHGGPIYEGLPVRIWYRDLGRWFGGGNEILRLDAKR
jgi:hypothetical protein